MRNTKKKIGLITGLLGSLLASAVAFAAFTGQLTITGTANIMGNPFKMVFADAAGDEVSDGETQGVIPASSATLAGDAEASDITVSTEGTEISAFNVKLYKTNDSVTYKFKIKNTGGTEAYLGNIEIAPTSSTPTGLELDGLDYSLTLKDTSNTFVAASTGGAEADVSPDGTSNNKSYITVAKGETVDCELTVKATADSLFAGPFETPTDSNDDNVDLTLGKITINWTSVDPQTAT